MKMKLLSGAIVLSLVLQYVNAADIHVYNLTDFTNAIANASAYTPIIIHPGTYNFYEYKEFKTDMWGTMSSPDNTGRSCVWFKKALIIRGESNVHYSKKTEKEETIIDGGNFARVFYGYAGQGRSTIYRNLTIKNGKADNASDSGGGIFSNGPATSSAIVSNCVFESCSAQKGGGTYGYSAIDTLYKNCSATAQGGGAYGCASKDYTTAKTNFYNSCVFEGCSSDNNGGGLYHENFSDMNGPNAGYVAKCVFSNCTAFSKGGALYVAKAGRVSDCIFKNNKSAYGAVYAENKADSVITNSLFKENVANKPGIGGGGGVGQWNNVIDCDFICNVSSNKGGAAANCNLYNCDLIISNISESAGGALLSSTASNCVFTGNRSISQRGGAMSYGSAIDCVFSNNFCTTAGRGGACSFVNVRNSYFTGVGDVSCGSFTGCIFDGVQGAPSPNVQKWVFDAVVNAGGPIGVTNCLVINCTNINSIINIAGSKGFFVNCTFANNYINENQVTFMVMEDKNYQDGKYYKAELNLINCISSGNMNLNENRSKCDMIFYFGTEDKEAGNIANISNCLYSGGKTKRENNIIESNIINADPRFVAGDNRHPKEPYYALLYSSVARNAGLAVDWPEGSVDLAGRERVNLPAVDIGCYECYLHNDATIMLLK